MNEQISIPTFFWCRAASKFPIFHIEVRGGFQVILVFSIPKDGSIDAVAARKKRQLIDFTDKP